MHDFLADERTQRRIGMLLVADAGLGLVLAVLGLVGLWWAEPRIRRGADSFAALAARTVDTTSGLLVSVDAAVQTARENMGTIEATVEGVADTLESTARLTRSAGDIAGRDVPAIIAETQTALESVESSSRLVDDTLALFARIPLIGARYEPPVPLHSSIERVNRSLDPLPRSLAAVRRDLADTSTRLSTMRGEIEALSGSIGQIETSLAALASATADYRTIAAGLQADLARFRQSFPAALRFATLFGTAVMLWLMLAQLGLLTQGLERLQSRAEAGAAHGPELGSAED
jgi:hypothetical protein